MSFFEAIMLLCFGLAWPMNIINALRSKTSKGRTILFQVAVLIGYFSGIIHKVLYSPDFIIVLYCINFIMVSIDTLLFLHYRRLENKQSVAATI